MFTFQSLGSFATLAKSKYFDRGDIMSYSYQVVLLYSDHKEKIAAFCDEFDAEDFAKRKKRDLKRELVGDAPCVDIEKISKGRPRANNSNAEKAIKEYLSKKGSRRKITIPTVCEKYGLSVATFNRRLREYRQRQQVESEN